MQQNPMIYQLYAVTAPAADLAEQVKRAIAGGITMLQIREKNCTTKRRIELAYPILQLCRDAGIPCIIDDDAEAAKILGADGVHVLCPAEIADESARLAALPQETLARLLLPLGEFDAGDLAELAQELQL